MGARAAKEGSRSVFRNGDGSVRSGVGVRHQAVRPESAQRRCIVIPRGIFLAGVAALLPVVAASSLAHGAPTEAPRPPFSPPLTDLVLTRTLWRSLHDGAEIMVRRRYDVQFVADGRDYRLDGKLIDAAVAAPPALAAFAAMEKDRPDTSLFPVRIDATGRILADGTPPPPGAHAQLDRVARSVIEQSGLGAQDKLAANQQLGLLTGGAGAIGNLPSDLFRPQPGERRERRRLSLPGGMEGAIEVAITVRAGAAGTLPQTVERVVTTTLEGTTRVSRELWSFERK